jgi:hypothetical protein
MRDLEEWLWWTTRLGGVTAGTDVVSAEVRVQVCPDNAVFSRTVVNPRRSVCLAIRWHEIDLPRSAVRTVVRGDDLPLFDSCCHIGVFIGLANLHSMSPYRT